MNLTCILRSPVGKVTGGVAVSYTTIILLLSTLSSGIFSDWGKFLGIDVSRLIARVYVSRGGPGLP